MTADAMTVKAHELRACLPALSERTQAQLATLYDDPTPDRCDLLVRALHEVATTVRRLGVELARGEPPTV